MPLRRGDTPMEKEGGVDFYPWFRVRDIDDKHLDHRPLLVWNDNNYMPKMKLINVQREEGKPIGDFLPPKKSEILVVDYQDNKKVFALMAKKSSSKTAGWDICVAPGADVAASKYRL